MMKLAFTVTQKQRLVELDAADETNSCFDTAEERDRSFKQLNQELVLKNKERLHRLHRESLRPAVRILESKLVTALNQAGFVEVTTPTTMSGGMLEKMGITSNHPLWAQVYWMEGNTCLRPMLAPNLYSMLGRLGKVWPTPVQIFEVGQCFRKESKGAKHLSEFTMLNLVEMGVAGSPRERLVELAAMIMDSAGLEYCLEVENSEVYGDTVDVTVDGLEVASGALGPHALDANWNICENWAGIGFGLERLVVAKEGYNNIRRAGRSLMYLDGARLNL